MESAISITEMIEAIQADVAEYARPLDATYTETLSHAVRHAVETFIERVPRPDVPLESIVAEFRSIGFAEAREGRSLEPLQAAMLPPDVLIDWTRREPCLVVPDPDGPGRGARIERALLGWPAAIGPVVPLGGAALSLRRARAALGLAARGVIDGGRLVRSDEHLSTLLIFADEELAGALRSAPLPPHRGPRHAPRGPH